MSYTQNEENLCISIVTLCFEDCFMKIVAITGSIGCGKTTLSKQARSLGMVVFDVDGWVRRLYNKKGFIKVVAKAFPEVKNGEGIDKRKLRNVVFNHPLELKKLEALIHPFLKDNLRSIIRKNAKRQGIAFIDVALLFEMGWNKYCDAVIVADVDYEIQKKRVMERDNVSAEDFEKINRVQMSNQQKKLMADVVVDTNKPINVLRAEMAEIINELGC